MAPFVELNIDVMRLIIAHTSPHDIESLTLTCKGIYNVGHADLLRHRRLKRKRWVWSCRVGSTRPSQAHLLLMDLLNNPHVDFYITKLSMCDSRNPAPSPADSDIALPEDMQIPYSEGIIPRVKEAISGTVPQDEVAEWLRKVKSGIDFIPLSLLYPLVLLPPNLSTLELEYQFGSHTETYPTLCQIVKMRGPGAPLSRLRHVTISNHHSQMDFKFVTLFAALPSIVSIKSEGIEPFEADDDPDTELVPRTTVLRKLDFFECSIEMKRLIGFLENFKGLRDFSYRHRRFLAEIRGETVFDPYALCCGLRASVGSTLVSLSIKPSNYECDKYLGDLRGFTNLRHLFTDHHLLLPSDPDACCPTTSSVRALPPKLETLTVGCTKPYKELEVAKFLLELPQMKTECVPALETVTVRHFFRYITTLNPDFTYETVSKAYSDQGIKLVTIYR